MIMTRREVKLRDPVCCRLMNVHGRDPQTQTHRWEREKKHQTNRDRGTWTEERERDLKEIVDVQFITKKLWINNTRLTIYTQQEKRGEREKKREEEENRNMQQLTPCIINFTLNLVSLRFFFPLFSLLLHFSHPSFLLFPFFFWFFMNCVVNCSVG